MVAQIKDLVAMEIKVTIKEGPTGSATKDREGTTRAPTKGTTIKVQEDTTREEGGTTIGTTIKAAREDTTKALIATVATRDTIRDRTKALAIATAAREAVAEGDTEEGDAMEEGEDTRVRTIATTTTHLKVTTLAVAAVVEGEA